MDSLLLAQKTQRGLSTRAGAELRMTKQGAHQRLRLVATENLVLSGKKGRPPG